MVKEIRIEQSAHDFAPLPRSDNYVLIVKNGRNGPRHEKETHTAIAGGPTSTEVGNENGARR